MVMLAMSSMIALIAMIAISALASRLPDQLMYPTRFAAPWARGGTPPLLIAEAGAPLFSDGNPLKETASKVAAELQHPTPGLAERRGVGGGSPRFAAAAFGAVPAVFRVETSQPEASSLQTYLPPFTNFFWIR